MKKFNIKALFNIWIKMLSHIVPKNGINIHQISMQKLEKKCCYVIFFLGFFGSSLSFHEFDYIRLLPFKITLIFLCVLIILKILISKKITLHHKRIKPFYLFFILWFFYSLASIIWSLDKKAAINANLVIGVGILILIFIPHYFREKQDFYNLFSIWYFVVIIMLIVGFCEVLYGYHFGDLNYYLKYPKHIYEPSGFFGNPNFYAAFLTISIPIPLYFIQTCKNYYIKGIGILILLSLIYLLIQTNARTSMVVALVELILFFSLLRDRKKIDLKFFSLICISLFTILLFIHEFVYNIYQKITIQLSSLLIFESTHLNSNQIRLHLIKNGIEFVRSTYGFGVGAGNEPFWQANFGHFVTGSAITSHSWWLEIFVNYGLFIFLGLIAIYLIIIKDLFKVLKTIKNRANQYIAQVLFLSLISITIIGVGIPMFAYYPNWMILAMCLSFLNNFDRISGDKEP
jgi:teichuronic acid biosynthesis protein TuaE